MIIKDMMPAFELYQPTQLQRRFHASRQLRQGRVEDGGRLRQPVLVQGPHQAAQSRDRPDRHRGDEGLQAKQRTASKSAALTTLTEIERNPVIKAKYRVLADAAAQVASPQIRNNGTLGGNVSQNARCLYYRYGLPCYRAGGNACFADTPEGINREHALFDTDRCVAVSPSDTAPALVALDAKFVIRSSKRPARGCGRGVLHRSAYGHHAHDLDQAGRNPGRDPAAQDLRRMPTSISRRLPTATPGTSRSSMSQRRSRCKNGDD